MGDDTIHIKKIKLIQAVFLILPTIITIATSIWVFSSIITTIRSDIDNLTKIVEKIPSIEAHIANDRVVYTEIKVTLTHIESDIAEIKQRLYKRK